MKATSAGRMGGSEAPAAQLGRGVRRRAAAGWQGRSRAAQRGSAGPAPRQPCLLRRPPTVGLVPRNPAALRAADLPDCHPVPYRRVHPPALTVLQEALGAVAAAPRDAARDQARAQRVERVLPRLHALVVVHVLRGTSEGRGKGAVRGRRARSAARAARCGRLASRATRPRAQSLGGAHRPRIAPLTGLPQRSCLPWLITSPMMRPPCPPRPCPPVLDTDLRAGGQDAGKKLKAAERAALAGGRLGGRCTVGPAPGRGARAAAAASSHDGAWVLLLGRVVAGDAPEIALQRPRVVVPVHRHGQRVRDVHACSAAGWAWGCKAVGRQRPAAAAPASADQGGRC